MKVNFKGILVFRMNVIDIYLVNEGSIFVKGRKTLKAPYLKMWYEYDNAYFIAHIGTLSSQKNMSLHIRIKRLLVRHKTVTLT